MAIRELCNVCNKGRFDETVEQARVHSNVRNWVHHESTVWRCPNCKSLHSLEKVDLAPFYASYPFSNRKLDGWTRTVFRRYLNRLMTVGLKQTSSLLDYGCSEGLLLDYLAEQGVRQLAGYDAYVERFNDPGVLDQQYDFVIAQDVVEHVEEPGQLLGDLAARVRAGGVLCIGTPKADAIDLSDTARYLHSLHQPYHIHILSEPALMTLADRVGLSPETVYRRHIVDTPYPFVNWTFLNAYLRKLDNTLDAGFEPPKLGTILSSPRLILMGLFGYLFPISGEMLALFRKT